MYGDGESWTAGEIHAYLLERIPAGDPVPSRATVWRWCQPDERQDVMRRRDAQLKRSKRAQRRAGTSRPRAAVFIPLETRTALDDQLVRLRHVGMTYSAISTVLRIYHGVELATNNVRARCRRLGCDPKPHGAAFQAGAR